MSFKPSEWSRGYVNLLLGEIGNILKRGLGVVGSLRRGLGSLRNGVRIMLTRDDVMRQEGETACARQNTGTVTKNVVNKFV